MCLVPDRQGDQGTYAGLVSGIFTTCLLVLVQFVLTTEVGVLISFTFQLEKVNNFLRVTQQARPEHGIDM